ncbi:hypothetical protein QYE76_069694 [Lolium multiflorum]|uniref:Ribonuclease H1 N-terminal domain-containing protein n=1 Tax=Lolium multiflorum TaxID=4521 RepID=A0AAD8WF60_LOLMU|nr:hypothetical protein QYE76_069694 [Lolium multiflorum]
MRRRRCHPDTGNFPQILLHHLQNRCGCHYRYHCHWEHCDEGEKEHELSQIEEHPKDAEYLNKAINNYSHVQQIFSFVLATSKISMGYSEPLGHHCPDYIDTQDSSTIPIDDDYASLLLLQPMLVLPLVVMVFMKYNWHVVFYGKVSGIYTSPDDVTLQVSGHTGNRHEGFKTRDEA